MKKRKKIMLSVLAAVITIATIAGGFVRHEIGVSPSKEDIAGFEKLPYFKNGEFQSPQKMIYDFDNVRNGPFRWTRLLSRSQFAPDHSLPISPLNKASFAKTPADFAFYWLGHSGAIMELGGKRLLIDPVLDNAAPVPLAVSRYDKAPLKRTELPEVDYILITHNHYDHLERKTVQSLKNGHFIVPLGVGAALHGWGIAPERITELGWQETFQKDGLKISAEEAVHFSGRGLFDRNKTLWNSYVLQSGGKNIYLAGDTGYGKHFAEIGRKYGSFDLVVIEIDGWNTGWPNTHLFPDEAVKAAQDLNAERFMPVHWGVFDLALHPWFESIDMVLESAKQTNLKILTPKIGEKINFDSNTSPWWRE